MAERRRNFRQEILDILRGNVEGWDAHGAVRDGFDELDELDLLHDTLEDHERQPFYIALKSLSIDPNLTADDYAVMVRFSYAKNLGVENEILVLREMPAAENLGLRKIIGDYLAFRREKRALARARQR